MKRRKLKKRQSENHLKPVLSILIVIFSLFMMVFLQMEVRRLGYMVWKKGREYKVVLDDKRTLAAEYAKITRPARLQEVAVNSLTLSQAKAGQIIHMSGDRVALKQ
jgi:hypothetical protein